MSLCIVVNGPEGVVLAADTRLTLTYQGKPLAFDNASKLLHIGPSVAAVVYGSAAIGTQPIHALVSAFKREFELVHGADSRLSVEEYATHLIAFLRERWDKLHPSDARPTSLIIAGLSPGWPHGEMWRSIDLGHPAPTFTDPMTFGMSWGGQIEVVNRLLHGIDSGLLRHLRTRLKKSRIDDHLNEYTLNLPFASMPLQDCIDLATLLIDTTIKLQALSLTDRVVGGTIEVMAITPEGGAQWVQRRAIHGRN